MAGEKYAKLTVRASWSWFDTLRGNQTQEVRFKLAGQWETYRRGGNPAAHEFVVPDPTTVTPNREFVLRGVENLLALLRATIAARGLSYAVSVPRDLGDDPATGSQVPGDNPWPLVEFDVVATVYDQAYNLDFLNAYTSSPGWQVVLNQLTVRPLLVTSAVTNALIYNSATGSITLSASNSSMAYPAYLYQWADQTGLGQSSRTNLVGPASYACTVYDFLGASTTVTVAVGADSRLEVLVVTTGTSIELQVSGGLPPYTYAWADGPTVALRQGLVLGTYQCRVTDSRGAFEDVEVVLDQQPYYWSRNPILLALDAGAAYRADPTTKPNLSFLCEVWVELDYLSGTFQRVGTTLEQPADRQGRTTFDVQALLDVFLDYHVPAPGSAAPQLASPLFRRFYLKHAEQYGAPVPVPAASTSLDHHYVVRGGLSFHETRARTWFTSYQPTQKPLLSWEPLGKYVFADQPEYLYYLVQGNPGDFVCRVRLHFSDGTEQVLTYAGGSGVLDCEVYCLPVGYAALGLGALPDANRQLVWWEVWVDRPGPLPVGLPAGGNVASSAAARLSEIRRYYLDTRVFAKRRYFLFATSLGGMATYAALGQAQLEAEVTGEETTRALPPDYDALAGDVSVLERALRPVLKVAAGPRTQAQLRASQDLLLSRRVLLLEAGRWVPGYLKAKTATLLDEGKLVQTQEFEFTQPTERLYTPAL